jgi:hypothetical protein
MSTPTREEFEARIEAVEARMDARVAAIGARLDEYSARADERMQGLTAMFAERDKRFFEQIENMNRRFDDRDKRIDAALQRISHLSTHMWMVGATFVLASAATVVGAYYAAQSSHLGVTQTVISAFQQGQQLQLPLRE